MNKRLISLCMVLFLFFSLASFSSATDTTSKLTPKLAAETVALSFMRNSISDAIEIVETTPYYDISGNVTAYCISFELDGNPSGYVLISLLSVENPIVEFSFEGFGITQKIREKQASFSKATKERIVYLGAGALFIQEDSGDYLYDVATNQPYMTNDLDRAYRKNSMPLLTRSDINIADGILSWNDSGIDSDSIVKIDGFGDGSDYWLMEDFSTGNVCAPTCATNVLWYWGVQRGRSWSIYIDNGNLTGFDLADGLFSAMSMNMATIPSLGTLELFVRGAYNDFIGFRGSNYYTLALTQNSYSSFTAAIDDDCPIHTSLRNQSLFSTGHDVMTFGYGESTSGTDYLFVMDGWYDHGRFVDFDYIPVVKGIKVWIGPTAN